MQDHDAERHKHDESSKSPIAASRNAAEALVALKAGNQRFAEGRVLHAHQAADWRSQLTGGQHPLATVLCCSDSRVPPELVFDQGLGDLFVVRVAGNIVDADVIGSIAYAVRHLQTALVLVMGHECCGAVTAALQATDGHGEDAKYIAKLLQHIIPSVQSLDPDLHGEARVAAAVEANVRHSIEKLRQIPEARELIENRSVRLEGAVYDIATGVVRFLGDSLQEQ